MNKILSVFILCCLASCVIISPSSSAVNETESQQLAKQLQNPVASLISIPLQNNFDSGLGAGQNGHRYLLKLQPVIPSSFNNDYNIISRPIFSYINQKDIYGATSQSGLSDTQLQIYFSPKSFKEGEMLWGAGPVLLIPTASEAVLGTEKWGIGPGIAGLKQIGPWSIGALFNHLWSFAGNASRSDISVSYFQPFLSHSSKHGTTFGFSSETTYDWFSNKWAIPLLASASQILPIGGHYFSFSLSGVYHVESPTPISKWGIRFSITALLPKK